MKILPAQGNQLTDFNTHTTQNFAANPQGLSIQGLRGWQSNRPIEQDNNQIPTTDQRKTLGVFIVNNSRY